MSLTFLSMNIRYGGRLDSDGRPDDRMAGILDLIQTVRPDVLLLQECHGWGDDSRLYAPLETALGMRALVAPSRSGAHTATLFRTARLRLRHYETKYAVETRHGFGVAVLEGEGLPVPITALSVHLHPSCAWLAAAEAAVAAERAYRYGGAAVIGGDLNHLPLNDPDPDWTSLPGHNVSSRAVMGPCGTPVGNRIVAQTLTLARLVDVAAHLADRDGTPQLRKPTGRGGIRVDQFWLAPALASAIEAYERLDPADLSDHAPILLTIDPARIDVTKV